MLRIPAISNSKPDIMGKYEAHSPAALTMNQLLQQPKFDLHLKIYDLINVPLVTGTSFVKWHVPSSTANEHRGRTDRAPIKAHKVVWKYERIIQLRLVIDKNNNLQDCLINFEVIQDCSTPSKVDKIILGKIELNLAEYTNESEFGSDDDSVLRRYLMQDSKINSTLKIGIWMKQVDGERNYKAPQLKTAMVFGGITGIVAGEQEGNEDVCHIPTTNRTRDQGEIQDLYRQILAASWASYDGELDADECIENIFNGGDLWPFDEKVKTEYLENPSDNIRKSIFSRHGRSPSAANMKSGEDILPRAVSYNLSDNCDMTEKLSKTGKEIYRELVDEGSGASRIKFQNLHDSDESTEKDDLIAWKIWQDSET
ncbi:uncharacterized protein GcM1_248039 [Golovinomyces cichoracearum]|uniref:C2 NT-type domain-containing protein n=1 Tax=Golovinomyces cichoracearum TaxID=62708 RepID=A0A420ICL0_9PEZI|nr:uncharacterized protein GcM1_248039 [Golovinomyces cichoracearum]